MFVKMVLDNKVQCEKKNVSRDDLVLFLKDHDEFISYDGVRLSAQLFNESHNKYLLLRFDDVIESKLTEMSIVNNLPFIEIHRTKYEQDYEFKSSIKISKITRQYLKSIAEKDMSYEDVIYVLLDNYFQTHEKP